jgi:hypothetical protein
MKSPQVRQYPGVFYIDITRQFNAGKERTSRAEPIAGE